AKCGVCKEQFINSESFNRHLEKDCCPDQELKPLLDRDDAAIYCTQCNTAYYDYGIGIYHVTCDHKLNILMPCNDLATYKAALEFESKEQRDEESLESFKLFVKDAKKNEQYVR
ncbi:hypothetical protein PFISCL1PPCAC_12445, partial [Pristionchus fissidentatus]